MEWIQLLSANRPGQSTAVSAEQTRSAFEQDYDRIIFSHPFRRLQDKTQVHPLPEHDFVHTRLTHSLEVSSVGRSLGRKAGEVIIQRHPVLKDRFSVVDFGAIVAAASLAHDLGNPPFGHAGESAISDFFSSHPSGIEFRSMVSDTCWADLVRFEGNAQGFRILNSNRYGLRLTCSTLGAFTKYPCPSLLPSRDTRRRSQKKFGFFQSEQTVFRQIAATMGLTETSTVSFARHPLAFLVEAADDVCYSIIDLEDGCSLGLVGFDEARDLFEGVISASRTKLGKLAHLPTREEKIGFLRALAISDLTAECTAIFLDHENDILSARFDSPLVDLSSVNPALKKIIEISVQKIYRARPVVEIEATGHEVLPGLLKEFTDTGLHLMRSGKSRKFDNLALLLPAATVSSIRSQPGDTYAMLRSIIDFISGMTDRNALSLYQKIKGIGA